jgi:hypothetical protein
MAVTMAQERRYAEVVTHVYTFLKRGARDADPLAGGNLLLGGRSVLQHRTI